MWLYTVRILFCGLLLLHFYDNEGNKVTILVGSVVGQGECKVVEVVFIFT